MGTALRLIWHKKAINSINKISAWYIAHNYGNQFVITVHENISFTVKSLHSFLSSGLLHKKEANKEYRSHLAHPKCRIYYWFDDKELHIIDIRYTL